MPIVHISYREIYILDRRPIFPIPRYYYPEDIIFIIRRRRIYTMVAHSMARGVAVCGSHRRWLPPIAHVIPLWR